MQDYSILIQGLILMHDPLQMCHSLTPLLHNSLLCNTCMRDNLDPVDRLQDGTRQGHQTASDGCSARHDSPRYPPDSRTPPRDPRAGRHGSGAGCDR